VGAAEAFIKEGENGYIYASGNVQELKRYIERITALSDDKLREMGRVSRDLSSSITPAKWADTLMKIVQPNTI
jgi:hypothetical protein